MLPVFPPSGGVEIPPRGVTLSCALGFQRVASRKSYEPFSPGQGASDTPPYSLLCFSSQNTLFTLFVPRNTHDNVSNNIEIRSWARHPGVALEGKAVPGGAAKLPAPVDAGWRQLDNGSLGPFRGKISYSVRVSGIQHHAQTGSLLAPRNAGDHQLSDRPIPF
jgi:hypothetical protein